MITHRLRLICHNGNGFVFMKKLVIVSYLLLTSYERHQEEILFIVDGWVLDILRISQIVEYVNCRLLSIA